MLHELLLSLWGCSTSITHIIDTDPLQLDNYLHPGERVLINSILKIVKECNIIRKFIKKNSSFDESNSLLKGLYLTSLCNGMDKALEPFREDVVDMERIILNDGYTPVSMILCRLQKYLSLFSVLNNIIKDIEFQNLHGCKILQCLHHYVHTGVPQIKQALEKMTHCVHVVFYKHLTSWLLYGHLEDVHREFFIQKTEKTIDMIIKDEKDKDKDKDTDIEKDKKIFSNEMWDYDINVEVLPYYIRPSLAVKILTIGQTIIMFGNDPRQKKDLKVITNAENLIWGEKEYEYFEKLRALQAKPTFALVEFERTVDELKHCVTQHLWHVAVEEAQLVNCLKLIKDFYLMGRGDMFLEFIRLATHILDKIPTNHTSRDINLAFQMALRKAQSADETALECFTFAVPSLPSNKDEVIGEVKEQHNTVNTEFSEKEREDPIDKKGWGLIMLKYKVTWPLHLLFNPSTLGNYNILFRFLLRVKKTQINLWNLWRDHMNSKTIDIDVIQLRNNLIFIVDNLQYYLQVDVIESQYTIMENNMKNTRNFEDVQKAHALFLINVMSRTFLMSSERADKRNPVNKLIRLLLRLCDDFIRNASVWEIENLLETEKLELKSLNDVLDGLMSWLTKTLNRVRAQPSGEHLAQLLLRLDYNRWFSSKKL
ncbi:PREDICTED: gamma-tubulin complex component 4 [Ceratosolen solmsi marchali]|uniref:Gamma-tubulin complex component n=1 Tax=Ceratosolen solmsi marchali TaxID=326594 RepID=A0AAJ6YTV2_9HYME|nr:PREDICTED: gamma-tubulin complex component 4 [Ceratosolen solmsi marchali]